VTSARRVSAGWQIATLAVCSTVVLSSQDRGQNEPSIRIVSPADGDYVSGRTAIEAVVEPSAAASRVIIYADGRQVCALEAPPFQCEWDAGAAVVEHQLRAVATLHGGGRVVDNVRTKAAGFTEQVDVALVQVTATVSDGRGRFVTGLPKSAFRVWEDGKPQVVTHFMSENIPLDLVVAVDTSGSMGPSMPQLKAAVKAFLSSIPAGQPVTLLGFNDNIFLLNRRGTDPADRVRAVDRLASWGATALYDVIIRGVEMLGTRSGRKALLVFTDGEDQGSHAPIQEAERRLRASDVTLYMIGQGRGTQLESLKKIMRRLLQPTGGRALFTDSIDDLQDAFSDILEELSHQYLLGYVPKGAHAPNTWHTIKVEVDGHSDVRARQGYLVSGAR
jgi:VWFA-related protein